MLQKYFFLLQNTKKCKESQDQIISQTVVLSLHSFRMVLQKCFNLFQIDPVIPILKKEQEEDRQEMSIVEQVPEISSEKVSSKIDFEKSMTPDPEIVQGGERRYQFRNRPHRLWRQSTEEYYLSTSSSGKSVSYLTTQNQKRIKMFKIC